MSAWDRRAVRQALMVSTDPDAVLDRQLALTVAFEKDVRNIISTVEPLPVLISRFVIFRRLMSRPHSVEVNSQGVRPPFGMSPLVVVSDLIPSRFRPQTRPTTCMLSGARFKKDISGLSHPWLTFWSDTRCVRTRSQCSGRCAPSSPASCSQWATFAVVGGFWA